MQFSGSQAIPRFAILIRVFPACYPSFFPWTGIPAGFHSMHLGSLITSCYTMHGVLRPRE
ncbi:hypothetical protein BDQ94DRAFT_146150 [Aspergillus welwitschiae]|uniref:Uncharacterized protein n=1 Tax=Aspergillus welwitschiae TaxID=1341132 RepID=A0A3F3PYJ2_9EURO|nr:hypothetical protein BDQ94DRAFT_146150 [Aspergillus welwitschiae]RDH31983.1 hypothetical protein BDQ94DRAFT_146150 [Aspergillus welwitschiae]